MMQTHLHGFLHYSQIPQPEDPTIFCPLIWDLREAPASSARLAARPESPLTTRELNSPATQPSVTSLAITCDLLLASWTIEARNSLFVTISDVLRAVYVALHVPIKTSEWDTLSRKQQDRIHEAFQRRCRLAIDPAQCEAAGVMRIDYLGHHTLFGGLSPSLETDNTCILSLRRLPRSP
ncbi:hypothetical protein CC1G_11079 [Coprinopsis cinerea okayama7|uniref:DUF6699 domain-containing protein n=1 Tax=Coprinopsis cinerea (strain Okayama-7 / 130 / ATCC MYA-4618 / FGSC 9003) TaxID=240176 RepID=A8NCB0_COPC7|nr:hypothetical protein CC1G_11079 [Coprinopsis cinerea okayama7\|eukprot:XP_001832454.2 hypothetical protein CC1G_11079 [Coprinopsis cinerea okayama7\